MNRKSLPNLNQMYDQLNDELFSGKLPKVQCVWNSRLSRSFGRTKYKRDRHSKKYSVELIDIQVGLSAQHLHKTLVHEMCHVWSIEFHQSRGHSNIFWKKMTECGYPDGHTFGAGIEQDKWQLVEPRTWRLQQKVFFDAEDALWEARIVRINKRTITVKAMKPRICKWRVSPGALRTEP